MRYDIQNRLIAITEALSDTIAIELTKPEYTGICNGPCQSVQNTIKMRKMNTSYVDQDMNYVECCKDCFEEIQEYWKERWSEYYSMII